MTCVISVLQRTDDPKRRPRETGELVNRVARFSVKRKTLTNDEFGERGAARRGVRRFEENDDSVRAARERK